MSWLSNGMIQGLGRALDQTSLQQKTTAQNIANVDTPDYKAKEVVFKEEFDRSLQTYRTDSRHLPFSTSDGDSFTVKTKTDTAIHNNGNNVDIDREMAQLAKEQIQYQALVQRLSGKFNSLKTVVKG
jgi:flagellar basal-body rod protein FlgB